MPRWKSLWRHLVVMVRSDRNYWKYVQNMRLHLQGLLTTDFFPYNFLLENFSCEWIIIAIFVLEGEKNPSQAVLFGSSCWGKSQNWNIGGTAASNQSVFTLLFIFLVSHSDINCSHFCLCKSCSLVFVVSCSCPRMALFWETGGRFFSAWSFPFLNSLKSSVQSVLWMFILLHS